ncbi:unnamed protein product [Owenia fusiformis]|uniref:Uncharacterized protein n=1 Tax=Owenia fusiformis TaxID=6347 RepID=A0A8J1XFW8_OWEFU|nr:unnamed protein product [Owenia fusiformis]
MARISLSCRGWQLSCAPHINWGSSKVLATCVISIALLCIIVVTVIETRRIQNEINTADASPRHLRVPRKKLSITEPTDVNDMDLHYGVVIDCGSSGSRVYVYVWPKHSGNSNELLQIEQMIDKDLKPVSKKIEPGLSTYGDKASEASEYIRPLLKYAADHIPSSKHKETPLYILATAGMRMLTESQQTAILSDLRVDLPMYFDFLFGENHVEVITGKQEGVYAWIAMNFALGRFDHNEDEVSGTPLSKMELPNEGSSSKPHYRKRTVGIIDMGGGSVQIAFEVERSDISKSLLAEFNLGCQDSDIDHTYRVYVTTFLGYGANAARSRYEKMLVNNTVFYSPTGMGESELPPIKDPCLPEEMEDTVSFKNKDYKIYGTGNYLKCKLNMHKLLNTSVPCQKEPCSLNGVHQPDINYHYSEFYGFSEFWYTMEDVFRIGGKYNFDQFEHKAKEYCASKWSTLEDWFNKKLYPKADQHRFKYQCFKSSWMSKVLHDGFKFPHEYNSFTSASLVDGKEVQWTLGALLYRTRYYPLRHEFYPNMDECLPSYNESQLQSMYLRFDNNVNQSDLPPNLTSENLREIQQLEFQRYHPPWHRSSILDNHILLVIIVFIILAIIGLYIRRMRKLAVIRAGLSRVPSMSYFMVGEDQMEQGIKIERTMYS